MNTHRENSFLCVTNILAKSPPSNIKKFIFVSNMQQLKMEAYMRTRKRGIGIKILDENSGKIKYFGDSNMKS